ncbi:MAG: hypothetical protein ACRD2W_09605, partial [Acidimicrobiales bacterium]
LALALLVRDDAAFTAFPADGTVFVVGADRLKAKYTGTPTMATPASAPPPPVGASAGGGPAVGGGPSTGGGTQLDAGSLTGPGPALALGEPKRLPGGVTVRTGDVPRSGVWLAAYAGSKAPAAQMQEAEAMAATVKVIPPPPGAIPPPPPPGSRPGFDQGGIDLAPGQGVPALSVSAPGTTYAVETRDNCAVVVEKGVNLGHGGGCQARPATATTDVVAVATDHGPPPIPAPGSTYAPGAVRPWERTILVLARVGPGVHRVTAVNADGRTANLTIGTDGWALGATDGRVFLLESKDRAGSVLAITPVT